MNHEHLQIRIYGTDGATRTFAQHDPQLIDRTLHELNPRALFSQDRITINDDDAETTFLSPALTRIDLVSDRLSVWDFPFVLGALVELTEAEFAEFGREFTGRKSADKPGGTTVFLKLEMLHGQHVFLWMHVIAGLPAARWQRIHSMFKERRLIFDLRAGGVGVLNLANLAHFSIHPELPELATVSGTAFTTRQRQPQLHLANQQSHYE
jgi:hypothetical protein